MIISARMSAQRAILLLFLSAASIFAQKPERFVRGNLIVSNELPEIKVEIAGDLKYVGKFDFRIRDVAAGERFVFISADEKKVNRMFIAQFEGFLPEVDDHYRYSFEDAIDFGGHKFRQNTYAFSNRESRTNNPGGEGALTEDFLNTKGYLLEDELMMSRFITVAGDDKKHELILYYFENISSTGSQLKEFYRDDQQTDIWKRISKDLNARSLNTFVVK